MNKKTVLKIILLMLIGGVFGAGISLGLIRLNDTQDFSFFKDISQFFLDYSFYFYIALFVLFFIPSVILYRKGKVEYLRVMNLSDEALEAEENNKDQLLDISMAINSIYIILNFMLIGTTFDGEGALLVPILFIFLFNVLAASTLEIIIVRFMQKVEPRLKGDPTSLKFQKDFLESCDEAEKLRVYKSGYKAFQFSRNINFGLLIFTILLNMTLEIGALPVFITSMMLIAQLGSFNYYAIKSND